MKTQTIIGALCLFVGVALGGISGAWLERRSSDERVEAAVQQEAVRRVAGPAGSGVPAVGNIGERVQ